MRVRLERMRMLYRARMKRLGIWPGMETPGVFVCVLGTVATLLFAA